MVYNKKTGVWGYSLTSKMDETKHHLDSFSVHFFVSAYALTVLAIYSHY